MLRNCNQSKTSELHDSPERQKQILYTVSSDIKKNVNHSQFTVWKDLKTINYKHTHTRTHAHTHTHTHTQTTMMTEASL